MSNNLSRNGVISSLDGLRAVSIVIVLLSHVGFGDIVPGGLGVTIFFFLSGYLITTLLMSEHERSGCIDIGKFYLRRSVRLLPPLLVTLSIAYSLVHSGALDGGFSWTGLLAQLFYFANYYGLFFDPGNTTASGTGILWSLAVEEHFYLLYPALLAVLLKLDFSPIRIAVVLSIICVAVLSWRIYLVCQPNFDVARTYYSSDTRVDSIMFGCMLALAANPDRAALDDRNPFLRPTSAILLAAAIITLMATLAWREVYFRETFRYSLQGLALMPVFYFAIKSAGQSPFTLLNYSWVKRLGVYSYAIYLSHDIVVSVVVKTCPELARSRPCLTLGTLAISILYAAILDVTVDSYFRRLRIKMR